MTQEKWYNKNKMLSYNQFINFIIGGRGIGKTFAMKKHCLEQFLKKGSQFIYLRRNKSELDRIDKEKFFPTEILRQVFEDFEVINSDVSKVHSKLVFKDKNKEDNVLMITSQKVILNGQIVCYMKSLSTWVDLKGSEYDDVKNILFDEVLIDTSSRKQYLKDEAGAFINLIYSVFRDRTDVHCYLLSNATNFNNPYFNFLGFYETDKKRFYNLKKKSVLIEFPPNKPFSEEGEKNPFYNLIKGTKYEGSIVENEFQVAQWNNVGKLDGDKTYLFGLVLDNSNFSCYYCNGLLYVDKGIDKNLRAYTVLLEETENNLMYLEKKSPTAKMVRANYLQNSIQYSSLEVKDYFKEVIDHVI